jgi:hypothetical protein
MENRTMSFDPALRFRYQFLTPEILNTVSTSRQLNVLVAKTSLSDEQSNALASIQVARWYCADYHSEANLEIVLIVPKNATTTIAVFERYGVDYNLCESLNEMNAEAVAALALAADADVVFGVEAAPLREHLIDDVMLVVDSAAGVLHNVEIHLKGFDIPWSFENPVKMQPWSNFYAHCETSIFGALKAEWDASKAAGPDVYNKMRILFGHSLPAMCFNRDRMEFYRQQDRWTDRNDIERQDFNFEYTTALNNFYVTMYAAVDLVAAMCVDIFGLEISKESIYAISGLFPKRNKAAPGLHALFTGSPFWDMYKIPRLIRHEAAHNGPVTPQTVYTGADDFTDEQIRAAAEEHGLYDDLHVLEKSSELPPEMRQWLLDMAHFKAKLKLWGRPLKHVVMLPESKGAIFYNPDPSKDLERFLGFFNRVLAVIKPWDATRPKLEWPEPEST